MQWRRQTHTDGHGGSMTELAMCRVSVEDLLSTEPTPSSLVALLQLDAVSLYVVGMHS